MWWEDGNRNIMKHLFFFPDKESNTHTHTQHPHTSHPRNRARLMLQSTFLPRWEVSAANLKCSPNLIRWCFFRYPPPIKWSDEWRDVIQGALGKRWFHMDVHGVKYLPSPLVSLRSSSLKKNPNETFCWTSCYVLVVQKILPEIRRIFRSGNWFPHVMICSLLCK